jgi:hypothetical protein
LQLEEQEEYIPTWGLIKKMNFDILNGVRKTLTIILMHYLCASKHELI